MAAYYNEFDPLAAAWLRELIKDGLIAPGDVDERSILEVKPDDLKGYTQHHFFAGIAVWSYALRRAGFADDESVMTGSAPCQPWSSAGKMEGSEDERHLWPVWFELIRAVRPPLIFGEQVASSKVLGKYGPKEKRRALDALVREAAAEGEPVWLDLVQADLEGARYSFGAVDLPAAGIGAPHIRSRCWWVAEESVDHAASTRRIRSVRYPESDSRDQARVCVPGSGGPTIKLADTRGERRQQIAGSPPRDEETNGREGRQRGKPDSHNFIAGYGENGQLANGVSARLEGHGGYGDDRDQPGRVGTLAAGPVAASGEPDQLAHDAVEGRRPDEPRGHPRDGDEAVCAGAPQSGRRSPIGRGHNGPGPTNGFWGDADWLFCRDKRWRPIEPGLKPLVDGAARGVGFGSDPGAPIDPNTAEARQGRLKGYGNAIVAEAAVTFVESYLEIREDRIAG